MSSMILQINNESQSEFNSDWNNPFSGSISSNKLVVKDERKLILFMIGGSAASIYSPLLRLFLKEVPNNYIVPIFIDRKFHSVSTSSAIEEIANYEEFCRLSLTESSSTEPLLFVDDSIEDILRNEVLKRIIVSIRDDDNIFICTSIHSEFNTNLIMKLWQVLARHISPKKISYGFFLPYLQFATNDKLTSLIHPDKEKQEKIILNSNLEKVENEIHKDSSKFIVGLSQKSIVRKTSFQCNPFNIVHLLMAYAAASSEKYSGGWLYYTIEDKIFLTPRDIIQSENFRKSLIIQDFSYLLYDFLIKGQYLPHELSADNKLNSLIHRYLITTSNLVSSLGDATSNGEVCMYLRNRNIINTADPNRNFRKRIIFWSQLFSKEDLIRDIYRFVDSSKIVNSNMAANQILLAINSFVLHKYPEISNLYL